MKDFFKEGIENIRALENVYIYRRLAIAAMLVAIVLAFGFYLYGPKHPFEQLALSIEEEFSFVDVINVDRSCVDTDCTESIMFLLFYELDQPSSEVYNQFTFRSMNGLYELSGDTDTELLVGIVILDTTILGGQYICEPREYITIELLEDNCFNELIRMLPIREKWVGR